MNWPAGQFKGLWAGLLANHPPEAHRAGTDTQSSTNDACFPRTLCVLHSPPSHPSVSNTEYSKANMRALGHPKYPFPGSKEPLVLPPDVCEHSVAWILFSSHYKDPTIAPTYVLPSIVYCFLTSESAQPRCLLFGADGQLSTKPFLPSPARASKPWMEAGLGPSDYRAQEDSVKGLVLERCSDLTAKHNLLCRDNLSLQTPLPSPGLTGSWDCWSRGSWFVKGSLPFQIAFQEARNCNL